MTPDEREDIEVYHWDIFSSICDEYFEIKDDAELRSQTHLIKAIELGALYLYEH